MTAGGVAHVMRRIEDHASAEVWKERSALRLFIAARCPPP